MSSTFQTSSNNSEQVPPLADRVSSIRKRVADAAALSNRNSDDITLIAVTKFHPAELVSDVLAAGITDIGESRPQELVQKQSLLADISDLQWHFVGQLQRNKAKIVRNANCIIHSVDRSSLLDALSNGAQFEHPQKIFLQLNLSDDPARGGVAADQLLPLAEYTLASGGFEVLGVMAVPRLGEPLAQEFTQIAEASTQLQSLIPSATAISAGMSGDFEEAIKFGATHLRIGTAITGPRATSR